ncbi:hypothetical protein [Paracoccus shanxieyensis]|uniref:Dyp-type peroxidase n=1 Tax=Paracoccus shanxieyensis TaxID=2675752 RepID=A0A6L6J4Y5_9RHOB|nr:hypothetical protein [Paracoccus shanxieyensis]MTH66300.1 hypothetical protein [Paracoccus shanxieyensis]MTH89091.1 hypothetical protein [Paracoccus shanxieyensis]
MSEEPALDSGDIQGNIIPGFRRRHQLLLGYGAGSEGILRQALAVLAPWVTSVAPVMRHRDTRKQALKMGTPEPEMPDLWANIALGAKAMDRLGENGVRALDRAFDIGMRPARTGDPWSPVDAAGVQNPWNPSNWVVGSPAKSLDLLLILAFDDWAASKGDELLAAVKATGLAEVYRECGTVLPGAIEHFGFMDGVAEIGIRGQIELDGAIRLVTTRYGVPPRDGVEYGRPGQPLAWPGQFLIGTATGQNRVDPAPERYRNGSFLVFRRLSQDVRAFDEDTQAASEQLGIPPARLRAAIVGRWPSGAALMRHSEEPASTDDHLAINYFLYGTEVPGLQLGGISVLGAAADPAPIRGLTCPAFAHIRKVNPRDLATDLGGASMTQGFQMLRRAIPFGPPVDRVNPDNPVNDTERGLLFLAYQRWPSLQFERLNNSWMNTDDGPGPGGFDLLVGQRVSPQTGAYEPKDAILYDLAEPAPGRSLMARRTWVRPSGGAYLFAPSLSLIVAMATAPPPRTGKPGVAFTATAKTFNARNTLRRLKAGPTNKTIPADTFPGPPRHDGEVRIRCKLGREEFVSASWPETALLARAAEALSGGAIASLDLSGLHFPTETLSSDEAAYLAQTDALRHLELNGVTLDGASLATLLRSLPRLQKINVAGVDLDDADIATVVEDGSELVELHLGLAGRRQWHRFGSPRLTSQVINTLGGATSLRRLSLRGLPIADADVLASDLWDQLVHADLSETNVSDAGAQRLAISPSLGELGLEASAIGDKGAAALLDRRWKALDLSWTRVSQAALSAARHPEDFKSLRLAGLALDDDIATLLGRADSLEKIDLSYTSVAGEVVVALGRLPRLRRVGLSSTYVDPISLAHLLDAPIEQLDAEGLQTDAGARRSLARNATLERVSLSVEADWQGLEEIRAEVLLTGSAPAAGGPPEKLSELQLTDRLTKGLADRLRPLQALRMLVVSMVDRDVEFDRGFERLQDVRAEAAGLTDEMIAGLVSRPSIAGLYISDNDFGAALEGPLSPSIHTLELRNTAVGDAAIKAIALLPRLHCIDLPNTKVTPTGISTLARYAINLQSLALDGSQIDKASVDALAQCDRLLELYLYGADISNATITAIAPIHLRELQLVGTRVDDEAVPYLAAIPGLRRLSLSDELSEEGLAALRALRPFLEIRSGRRTLIPATRRPGRFGSRANHVM